MFDGIEFRQQKIRAFMKLQLIFAAFIILFLTAFSFYDASDPRVGTLKYDDFQTPLYCGASCHTDFYQQWKQSMMSQAYTHHWDEIEYFQLAVPHAEKDPAFAEIKAGCNGCHAPMAYITGNTPPPRPEENDRANESVACDICHSITGFEGDTPFNFNYIMKPGKNKYTFREGDVKSPNHDVVKSDIHKSGDFCGICHNEKNSFGIWVKSTHLEWKAGPYFREGVQCQDCHMPKGQSLTASMGVLYQDTPASTYFTALTTREKSGELLN
jgi:hypothetical protein